MQMPVQRGRSSPDMALGIINVDQVLSNHVQLLQAVGVLRILNVSYVLQCANRKVSARVAGHEQPQQLHQRPGCQTHGLGASSTPGGAALQNMCSRAQPDA